MAVDIGDILPIIQFILIQQQQPTAIDFLCCLHTCVLSTLLYLTVLPYFIEHKMTFLFIQHSLDLPAFLVPVPLYN